MAVRWEYVRGRYVETPPLQLLDELRDATRAEDLILRSMALGSIGRPSEGLRDLERAAAQDGDDVMLGVWFQAARACLRGSNRERIDVANRLWEAAATTPDPARTRRAAAVTGLKGTRHGSPEHRAAAQRLVTVASEQLDGSPGSAGAAYDLAIGNWELGDQDAAASTLSALDRQGYPPWPHLWSLDAAVARKRGERARARASWLRHQQLLGRPTDPWRYQVFRWCLPLQISPWLLAIAPAAAGWVVAAVVVATVAAGIQLGIARVLHLSERRTLISLATNVAALSILLLLA